MVSVDRERSFFLFIISTRIWNIYQRRYILGDWRQMKKRWPKLRTSRLTKFKIFELEITMLVIIYLFIFVDLKS